MRIAHAFVCLGVAFCATATSAAPVVETGGRLEVNWGKQRIRFYGEAKTDSDGEGGLKSAEKRAWQDGLNYISDAVRDLNVTANEDLTQNTESLTQHAASAAKQVATSTFSYDTTYYGDGTVRVRLENTLPRALEVQGLRFKQKEALPAAMTHYSGLVLQLDKGTKPRATYAIVDEKGDVLFDVHDMAEDAYKHNLMGRWFRKPTQAELVEAVGKNPVTLAATVANGEGKNGDGSRFVVKRAAWDEALEGHKALLVNGTVALALP